MHLDEKYVFMLINEEFSSFSEIKDYCLSSVNLKTRYSSFCHVWEGVGAVAVSKGASAGASAAPRKIKGLGAGTVDV